MQNYEVKIGVFEGPLDLLVYLVQKNELHPRDIPISLITDQFLEYIDRIESHDLSVSGEFLVMAARLMRLKAQEMLPNEEKDELEEMEFNLDREELIKQMLEHHKFKEVSKYLRHLELRTSGMFKRGQKDKPPKEKTSAIDTSIEANIYDLLLAFSTVTRNKKRPNIHQVEIDDVTIENQIKRMQQQLKMESHFLFDKMFENDPRNIVIVVSFMSLLELTKLDEIRIFQHQLFGPIWIYDKTKNIALPQTSLASYGDFDDAEIKEGLVDYLKIQMEKNSHKNLFDEVIEELEREMNDPEYRKNKELANKALSDNTNNDEYFGDNVVEEVEEANKEEANSSEAIKHSEEAEYSVGDVSDEINQSEFKADVSTNDENTDADSIPNPEES